MVKETRQFKDPLLVYPLYSYRPVEMGTRSNFHSNENLSGSSVDVSP
jgi:hypothetical protein